ncbi:MAG: hypothetical protein MUC85_04115 [Anaerolineales bacterium]|jgi:hypothetical protein|nr:hypothetical protein [Anaerolineales bacterium]
MPDKGILYMILGEKPVAELRRSVQSVRLKMPGTPITVIADQRLSNILNLEADQINFIEMPEQWDWKIKVEAICRTPYDRTIFLDADTLVCDDISELFTLLDRFDICACLEPSKSWGYELEGLLDTFPQLNSGVIAFKKSVQSENFFQRWLETHAKLDQKKAHKPKIEFSDQNSLRYALYHSPDIHMYVLPPEFNCRVGAGYAIGKIKVIHAHGDLHRIEQIINASTGARLYGTIRGKFLFVLERKRIRTAVFPGGVYNHHLRA